MNDSKEHYFCVEAAKEFGLRESVVLSAIIKFIESDGKKIDGSVWITKSVDEIRDYLYYMTSNMIRDALINLENSGALISKKFGEKNFDRRKSYSVTELGRKYSA